MNPACPRSWQLAMSRLAALLAVLFWMPAAPAAEPMPVDSRESLNGVLWMQTAHEYALSTAQVYAVATRALEGAGNLPSALVDPDLPRADPAVPPAIVLDLDETVLDTTRYAAALIAAGQRHTEEAWNAWVTTSPAEALAGALDFLAAARARGLRIFYVTNRACPDAGRPAVYPHPDCPQRQATQDQARQLGLPFAEDPRAFLLRNDQDGWESGDKSPRRRFLAGTHRVVMLLGDDLGDFLPRDQVKALRDQRPAARPVGSGPLPDWRSRFGSQWFLLPNPSYGSWEVALAACPPGHGQGQACYEARRRAKYERLIPDGGSPAFNPTLAPRLPGSD